MPNYNSITIVGHLTRSVEQKAVGDHVVYEAGIAVNNGYGEKQRPCFIDVNAWNKTGAALAKLNKGDAVMLVGSLEQDTWEKDGQKRSKHKITVNQVVFLGGKRNDGERSEASAGRNAAPSVPAPAAASFDETPF